MTRRGLGADHGLDDDQSAAQSNPSPLLLAKKMAFLHPATKRLLEQAQAKDAFSGDFDDVPAPPVIIADDDDDDDDENPFGEVSAAAAVSESTEQPDDVPLLRATRDVLNGDFAVDLAVDYAGAEFDRLMLERAIAADDGARAKVAAERIHRARENAGQRPPEDVLKLRDDVNASTVATADDRRSFETAFNGQDWTMARLIGGQIVDFTTSSPRMVDV